MELNKKQREYVIAYIMGGAMNDDDEGVIIAFWEENKDELNNFIENGDMTVFSKASTKIDTETTPMALKVQGRIQDAFQYVMTHEI